MEHEDWYWTEDEDYDPEVLAQLEDLYVAHPDLQPTPCSGIPIYDLGVTLALYWEVDRRADYERALPIWHCDCGAQYKRERWSASNESFYTITDDGLLAEHIGSLKGKRGIAAIAPDPKYPANNGGCPSCGHSFKKTIERQADPQTSLLFDLA
jgi:hypothetical protein